MFRPFFISVPPTVYNIKNVTQSEGLSTTLVCLSWGDPAPEMTYRKEGHTEDYVLGPNVMFSWRIKISLILYLFTCLLLCFARSFCLTCNFCASVC